MPQGAREVRLLKEKAMLEKSPPAGVSCWTEGDRLDALRAEILGAAGTPYAGGLFRLELSIPQRYPFEPPAVRFVTPIYHPNVDTAGRICLDLLKSRPRGTWKPSVSLGALLTSIQLLMAEPNPDDGLLPDVSAEYKNNRPLFERRAREHTEKHARKRQGAAPQEAEASSAEGAAAHTGPLPDKDGAPAPGRPKTVAADRPLTRPPAKSAKLAPVQPTSSDAV